MATTTVTSSKIEGTFQEMLEAPFMTIAIATVFECCELTYYDAIRNEAIL